MWYLDMVHQQSRLCSHSFWSGSYHGTVFLSFLITLLFLLFHYSSWSPSAFESVPDSWWYELPRCLCGNSFWGFFHRQLFNFRDWRMIVVILVCVFCLMPQAHDIMRQLEHTKAQLHTILQLWWVLSLAENLCLETDPEISQFNNQTGFSLFRKVLNTLAWQYLIVYANSRMHFNLSVDFIGTWPEWTSVFSTMERHYLS